MDRRSKIYLHKKKIIAGLIGVISVISVISAIVVIVIPESYLENPSFDSPIDEKWYSKKGSDGDNSDVDANTGLGHVNLRVLGEQKTFDKISGIPQASKWTDVINPDFPAQPDNHWEDSNGLHIIHEWGDGSDPDQSPSVNWDRDIEMDVDMSDYEITSASLTAVVNADVNSNVDAPGDSTFNTQGSIGDYVRFYVLFSDLGKNRVYEVAYNQSYLLGRDSGPITSMPDTIMTNVPEESLIFYLTSVLESDNRHFTVTLGMRIFCEDNIGGLDTDTWNDVCIKSCDLTFTYKKKIDKFTSVSWNQEGEEISGKNVKITDANLKFKYKIDQSWPSLLSPSSEIRILINNKLHSETIRLSSAKTSFEEAKEEGFDITSLISKNEEIILSIQIFIADTFKLGEIITISIDDVYLDIDIEITGGNWTPLLIGLTIGIIAITSAIILYEKHFKYPPMVRKAKKLRKNINKRKQINKPIAVHNRDEIVKKFLEKPKFLLTGDISHKTGLPPDKVEIVKGNKELKNGGI